MLANSAGKTDCRCLSEIEPEVNLTFFLNKIIVWFDAVTGAATVILAMGAGKAAAKGIDEYLSAK